MQNAIVTGRVHKKNNLFLYLLLVSVTFLVPVGSLEVHGKYLNTLLDGMKHFNISGPKLLQLFFPWASFAFEDFKEPMIHLNQKVMNLLLRYLLGRFAEVIKTKETVI